MVDRIDLKRDFTAILSVILLVLAVIFLYVLKIPFLETSRQILFAIITGAGLLHGGKQAMPKFDGSFGLPHGIIRFGIAIGYLVLLLLSEGTIYYDFFVAITVLYWGISIPGLGKNL